MKYEKAQDIQAKFEDIVLKLGLSHIKVEDVVCIRSFGSSSRGTIARCHALSKPLQLGLGRKGFYLLEFISERFDKMPEQEKIKVVIHELMHIPKCFGGGFKHHDFVCKKNVEKMFDLYNTK
jgi:predicted metallopeptidase